MTSLVVELQADALNDSVPVLSLLRKARVLSVKLGITTIDNWLDWEMNGYPDGAPIPSYRHVVGQTVCFNPHRGCWIPMQISNREHLKLLTNRKLGMPLSELCDFVAEGGASNSLMMHFSPDVAADLRQGHGFEPALEVGMNLIFGIMATVRNKVLDFALSVEQQGILGVGMTFTQQDKEAASHIVYNVNIEQMTGSQLQQGTTGSSQNMSSSADLGAVTAFVERMLPAIATMQNGTDRDQLQCDLETIRSQLRAPKPKVGLIRECLTSVRTVLEGTAGNVLASEFIPALIPLILSLGS